MVEKLETFLTISDDDDGTFTKCCHDDVLYNIVTSSVTYVSNAVTWILNALFLTISYDDDGKSIECCHDDNYVLCRHEH